MPIFCCILKKDIISQSFSLFSNMYLKSPHTKRLSLFFEDITSLYHKGSHRIIDRSLTHFITDHGPFAATLNKMKLLDSPTCRFCKDANETSDHLMSQFPGFAAYRRELIA